MVDGTKGEEKPISPYVGLTRFQQWRLAIFELLTSLIFYGLSLINGGLFLSGLFYVFDGVFLVLSQVFGPTIVPPRPPLLNAEARRWVIWSAKIVAAGALLGGWFHARNEKEQEKLDLLLFAGWGCSALVFCGYLISSHAASISDSLRTVLYSIITFFSP